MEPPPEQPLAPFTQLSGSGGVNRIKNYREMRPDEYDHIENGTLRGGLLQTRPGFDWLGEFYDRVGDADIVRFGKVQGSAYYGTSDTGAMFVYAIEGQLFGLDPTTGAIFNLNPPGCIPFNKEAEFVYLEERDRYMIAQDGINLPVIIDGHSARFSDLSKFEVPIGKQMASGWGYLCLASSDGRRIYISDHEALPLDNVSPLTFDAAAPYYLSAPYFIVPKKLGKITAMQFIPWAATDAGIGPLAVFCEHGVMTYDLSIPRNEWLTQDIAAVQLNQTGGVGPYAVCEWSNDLWFTDQFGRIRTIRATTTDESTRRVRYTDLRVSTYYDDIYDDPGMRRWRRMIVFDNRVFTTIWPEVKWLRDTARPRHNVAHRGMVVWEGEVTEITDTNTDRDIWAGVWTGINPMALDSGLFLRDDTESGEEIAVALCADPDGVNRFYRLTKSRRCDAAPDSLGTRVNKRISMRVAMARTDFGVPFTPKRLTKAAMRITGMRGHVSVSGWMLPDSASQPISWFKHEDIAADIPSLSCEGLIEPVDYEIPRLNLPAFQTDQGDPISCRRRDSFYSTQMIFQFDGSATFDTFGSEAKAENPPTTTNVRCAVPEFVPIHSGCLAPVVTYSAFEAEPITHYQTT